ncbi:response regulator [Bacteroides sp.]|uniref:PAS domain-containing hybrid sensor histidine kinase/response regulator n=1 Tax=Bacteroides sp. TaxID=29523 RepID=UPI002FC9A5C8
MMKNQNSNLLSQFNQSIMTIIFDRNLSVVEIINPQHYLFLMQRADKFIGCHIDKMIAMVDGVYRKPAITIIKYIKKTLLENRCHYFEYIDDELAENVIYSVCYTEKGEDDRISLYIIKIDEDSFFELRNGFFHYVGKNRNEYLSENKRHDLEKKRIKLDDLEYLNFANKLILEASHVSVWCLCISDMNYYPIYGEIEIGEMASFEFVKNTIVHPDDRDRFIAIHNKFFNGEISHANETFHFISVRTGEDLFLNNIMSSVFNSQGNLEYILGTQKNVAEELQQKKLLESLIQEVKDINKKNEIILNNLNAGLVYIDTSYRVIWENVSTIAGHPRINKYKQGEVCYKTLAGRNSPCDGCLVLQVMQSGEILKRVERESDTVFEITFIPVNDENQDIIGLVCRLDDITEIHNQKEALEKSKEDLELALQAGSVAAWTYDVRNKMFYTLQGKAFAGDGLTLDQHISMIHPDDVQIQLDSFYSLLSGNKHSAENVFRYKIDSEEYYHYYESHIRAKRENGQVVLITGTQKDITQHIQIQDELQKAKAKAEQSDHLKSAFLANMSHEIRTPLNAIIGFSDLMKDCLDQDEKEEYGKIISTNSELLLRLIDDILDLSKIESGAIQFDRKEFDLAIYFDELVATMQVKCTNLKVEFISINPYQSCLVTLDKNRLAQLLTNLVSNSIKYTPEGYIKMGYEYLDDGIKFYVEDSGIGISEDKKDRVFHRFEKLDDFAQGTGLGLSICKAITEANGGSIGFDSIEGVGSTFWIWVPCKVKTIVYEGESMEKQIILKNKFHINKPLLNSTIRVLVAEDKESNYQLVQSILRRYDLTWVKNGLQAVEAVQQEMFDIVLMDIKMPVMNGIEATRKIREFNSDIPIVALTANAFDSDKEEAFLAGCNEFLVKPLKKSELLNTLSVDENGNILLD